MCTSPFSVSRSQDDGARPATYEREKRSKEKKEDVLTQSHHWLHHLVCFAPRTPVCRKRLTCRSKKRRKKCDEERPKCLRCRKGGFVCDGYAPTTVTKCPATPPPILSQRVSSFSNGNHDTGSNSRLLLPADYLESYFYAHFFAQTVSDLKVTPCIDAAYWRESFMVPSQITCSVRQATIALGAMHWLYTMPMYKASRLEIFVIKHYNMAVSELLQCTGQTQQSPKNMFDTLICCFMFVILECLRGNYGDAMRHLESGSKLLTTVPIENSSSSQAWRNLAAMFHAISSQVSLFSDDRLLPDLTHCMIPMKKYTKQSAQFRDIDEAEDVMNSFDDTLIYIKGLRQDWDEKESECCNQWAILRRQVEAWSPKFADLIRGPMLSERNPGQQKRIVNLQIQIRLWELEMEGHASVDMKHQLHRDDYLANMGLLPASECFAMLERIEQVWQQSSRPEFGLKCDLVTAMFQLYGYCPDLSARQRIIAMLRSRKYRAIVWDSHQLAEFLEATTSQQQGTEALMWPDIGPCSNPDAFITFKPRNSCT